MQSQAQVVIGWTTIHNLEKVSDKNKVYKGWMFL